MSSFALAGDVKRIRNTSTKDIRVKEYYQDGKRLVEGISSSYFVYADVESHIRLFDSLIGILPTMNKGSIRMLFYIMKELGEDDDRVFIERKEVVSNKVVSDYVSMWRVLKDLIEKGVIKKGEEKNEYIVNTNMFFNGSRDKYYERNKM